MIAKSVKRQANSAVGYALQVGWLVKPHGCERADGTCAGRLEAHHESYEPSMWLTVQWLCASHHRRIHPPQHHLRPKARQYNKPTARIELATARLRIGCSTAELSRRNHIGDTNGNETATDANRPPSTGTVSDTSAAA